MSYSISVLFNSEIEKDRMKKFLTENIAILNEFKKNEFSPEIYFSNQVMDGEDLAYAPKKHNLLGFHGSIVPSYAWGICAWMAVKSKITDSHNNNYFYYDEDKYLVTFKKTEEISTVVDINGVLVLPNDTIKRKIVKKFFGIQKNIKENIQILNKLNNAWNLYI